jgi:hypothetical protein
MARIMRCTVGTIAGLVLAGAGTLTANAQALIDVYTTGDAATQLAFTPGATGECQQVAGAMQGVFFGTVLDGAVGTYTATGSDCGSSTSGTLTVDVEGFQPNGSVLSCPSLTGTSVETAATLEATLQGFCRINDWPTGTMTFTTLGIGNGTSYIGVTTSVQQKPGT